MEAHFLRRDNRFLATVDVNGKETKAHVANSGRLGELLSPGNTVFLTPVDGARTRKTAFDVTLVQVGCVLVSMDARLPSKLLKEAVEAGSLPELADHEDVVEEVPLGDSRIDLMLVRGSERFYIETKSVTLVEERTALFPDAPTARGAKHLRSLEAAVKAGHRAAAVFVVQREDAVSCAVDGISDPQFAAAIESAAAAGVEVYAYRCNVTTRSIAISDRIPYVPPHHE